MNNDYSFEQFQKRRKELKNKTKSDKDTQINLFVKTFSIFLFSFLLIATIISPHINIPALSDDDSSLKDISSSDFKSRIDYRLKQIQDADTTKSSSQPQEGSALQNMLTTTQDNLGNSELPTFNTPKLPEKTVQTTNNTNFELSKIPTTPQGQYIPLKPNHTAVQQQTPAPYVPKTQTSKNYRILVGNYTSPEDAERVADLLAGPSGSKPMIKSHNGSYCLQVGVFNDAQKAQNVADVYSAKNYRVKVIEN